MRVLVVFFFNDTATTEIYTLSLHDALPILARDRVPAGDEVDPHHVRYERDVGVNPSRLLQRLLDRSEEHTSELQSRQYLVCRLLLEKKNNNNIISSLKL